MDIKNGVDVNWFHMTYDEVQWKALVNMIMNLQGPQKSRKYYD